MQSCIDGIAVSPPIWRAIELVHRRADVEIGALRLLRVRLREEHRARPEVVAADLRRVERLGHAHVGVADDREVLAPRLERRQRAVGMSSKSSPVPAGAQRFFDAPQMLRSRPRRAPTRCRRIASCRPATARAATAWSATRTPAPSRRGRGGRPSLPARAGRSDAAMLFPVRICMVRLPRVGLLVLLCSCRVAADCVFRSLAAECTAVHDPDHERRQPVAVRLSLAGDRADRRLIEVLDAAAQRVRHEVLRERAHQRNRTLEQRGREVGRRLTSACRRTACLACRAASRSRDTATCRSRRSCRARDRSGPCTGGTSCTSGSCGGSPSARAS